MYGDVLRLQGEDDFKRDKLIVSKGHCVLSYYSALYEKGFITLQDIESFEVNGSRFHGHATRDTNIGIDFSGGSLGMGFSYAVGLALAGKMRGHNYKVYVILGDGECDEGSNWEAAMSAAHFELDNLIVIIDHNKLQYDGDPKEVMNLGDLHQKFKSFGFDVDSIDGHCIADILTSMQKKSDRRPRAIVANTIKGKGISFMENKKEWHHSKLTKEQYEMAKQELE